jgi:oxygen-dependent protoporphyrinogen oxidase
VDGESPVRAHVTVLEASSQVGGKLRLQEVGSVIVDVGAESLVARRPEGLDLARDVGLGEDLEPPTTARAALWNRGTLAPIPGGQLMGVPGDIDALAASGVLSREGLARAREDERLPSAGIDDDIAVGRYVADRVGQEVVDRLVEPLLGGVYAGQADRMSLRAAVPQLVPIARGGGSLVKGVRDLQERLRTASASGRVTAGPVFQGIRGGIGRLAQATADAVRARGGDIWLGARVTGLRQEERGRWSVTVRTGRDERRLTADAVVLALPAPGAAQLLAGSSPVAAEELAAVEYASVALVTMTFDRLAVPAELFERSGFLVPPVDGRAIKAATFSSSKWKWLDNAAPTSFVLRTSLGRFGEEAVLQRSDDELVSLSLADLKEAVGLRSAPHATSVTRWDNGLPQYPVGHLDRIARVQRQLDGHASLALCGAAYGGVGIPACIATARRAADKIVDALSSARC